MTVRHLLILILCAISLTSLGACGLSTKQGGKSHAKPTVGTTWVVLGDLSGSTLSARHDFINALRRILSAVHTGDTIAILSIEQSSIENSRYLYQGTFPRFVFKPDTLPDTNNTLLLKTFEANEKQRYAAEKTQFERSHSLSALRRQILASVTRRILTYKAPATDIFGALSLSGNLFSISRGPKRLVMLTDGVVEDQQVNFRRQALTNSLIEQLAREQRRQYRLPALHGTRVLVIGARLGGAVGFAGLSHAWQLYINKYVGGHLQSRFFMSRLSDQLFREWLSAKW